MDGKTIDNRWGIELEGALADKEVWHAFLKPPFDPFVEEIKDIEGGYLVLRSSAFDRISTSRDVRDPAKKLFSLLNVVMSKNAGTDPVAFKAVVEFVEDGPPRKQHFLEVEPLKLRVRGGIVNMTVRDADGNVIGPPPKPSTVQLWMRAAALEPQIGSALKYLEGKPNWHELYKAYEALGGMPNGGLSKKQLKRFTHTANSEERHHSSGKKLPPKHPMELQEGRSLMTQWVATAIDHVLSRNS